MLQMTSLLFAVLSLMFSQLHSGGLVLFFKIGIIAFVFLRAFLEMFYPQISATRKR